MVTLVELEDVETVEVVDVINFYHRIGFVNISFLQRVKKNAILKG